MAVLDLETTGLSPGGDRIVEIAVVRIEPGQEPVLVLDTLVNPGLPISGTEIHGISDGDVIDAPSFTQVAGNLASALTDSVFASYNVYFDVQFVQAELTQVGIKNFPPHLCLMYMRPLLGLGPKCSLTDACEAHSITYSRVHQAASDAMVGALLWQAYTPLMATRGIRTFGDLAKLKAYKFTKSFSESPFDRGNVATLQSATRLKSRTQAPSVGFTERQPQADRTYALAEYWDALTAALADLIVTPAEIHYLQEKRRTLSLTVDEVRGFHARVFSRILADLSQDKVVTRSQAQTLQGIAVALHQLGWEPGDSEEELILSAPTETIMARPQKRSIWDTLTSWFRPRKSISTTPDTIVPPEQASGKITPTTRPAGTTLYIIVPLEQGSLTWLEWRDQGIGSSDAPIVMDESRFMSAEELLRQKQASFKPGLVHDFSQYSTVEQDLVRDFDQNSAFRQDDLVRNFSQKSAMAQGTELEPVARGLYIATTGREVYPACLQSTRYEWLRASLDGLTINHDVVVEIKCGRSAYRIAAQTHSVPKYYYGQVQHILAVTGFDSLDFWCYWPGYPPLLIPVPRDAAYIERLLKTEMEFWTRIQRNL